MTSGLAGAGTTTSSVFSHPSFSEVTSGSTAGTETSSQDVFTEHQALFQNPSKHVVRRARVLPAQQHPIARGPGHTSSSVCQARTQGKVLEELEPPPGGHRPLSLANVGQSKIYVRPLQRDIRLNH